LGGQSQGYIHVPAGMRMVVHPHAVKTSIFAASDEVGDARNGVAHGNADVYLHHMAPL
jgi:hypothetical protein